MRKVLAETSVEDLKSYMELHVINAYAGFLSDAFTDRAFEASKVISGVQEQQPRWKLCSMTFTLGKTRINSVLLSLNHVIRHKPLHNIPLMQGFLQLSVILQRHIRQISQRIN